MTSDRHALSTAIPASPDGTPTGSGIASASARPVFISYSRKDRAAADALKRALESHGFKTWIDCKDMPGSRDFGDAIDAALGSASAAVVLWSEASVASKFVKDEADRALARGVLIAARLDDAQVPLGFGRLNTFDLHDWDQQSGDHAGLSRLLESVAALARNGPPTATAEDGRLWMRLRCAVAALGALLFVLWLGSRVSWLASAGTVAFGIIVALALSLLGRRSDLNAAARVACSKVGAGVFLGVGLACWMWAPIRVSTNRHAADKLTAEVYSAGARISGPNPFDSGGFARLPVFAWIWGRDLTVRVPGHVDHAEKIFPWSSTRLELGSDIIADPTLFVRIGPETTRFATDSTIEVLEDGAVLAGASLTENSGSAMFGPPDRIDLDSRVPAWDADFTDATSTPENRGMIVTIWRNPAKASWRKPPSSIFAKVAVRLTTRTGHRWLSTNLISVSKESGEANDEKVTFKEE